MHQQIAACFSKFQPFLYSGLYVCMYIQNCVTILFTVSIVAVIVCISRFTGQLLCVCVGITVLSFASLAAVTCSCGVLCVCVRQLCEFFECNIRIV